ncbi:MAG: hypothetical protein H6760_02400 [Candidatus Nomurabacteria bacterium]|nr:MAG: hypothetical protein H6760_02400 [Candidatus Nomurabacteria bacterium]
MPETNSEFEHDDSRGTLNSPGLPDEPVAFSEPDVKKVISPKSPRVFTMLLLSLSGIVIVGGGILLLVPKKDDSEATTNSTTNALQDSIRRILPERQPGTNASEVQQTQTSATSSSRAVNQNTNTSNVNSSVSYRTDTDNDGLLDRLEAQYGSDPEKSDTDGDGLNDLLEVYVYQTDPTEEDSDGDGFSDGEEVKNGYNPNGLGRI